MRTLRSFWDDKSGATSIEYALIASMIALVIIVALKLVGTRLTSKFSQVSGNLA